MRPRNLVAIFLLAAASQASDLARAGCRAGRVAEFPLQLLHNRLFIPLKINDTGANFLLDTGAFHSIMDSAFASRAHVNWDDNQPSFTLGGIGGETLPVHAGRIRMLDIAGIKVPDREMPIHDFAPETLSGAAIDGLFGSDLISVFDLELDFPAGRVSLWRLIDCQQIEPLHWSGDYAAIPMTRRADKTVVIPIEVDGAFLDAVLDTGAGPLLLTRQSALAAGATPAELAQDPAVETGGIGGKRMLRRHVFHALTIGKETYPNVAALISDHPKEITGNENLIGLDFLRGHRAWLSYGTETLFLQRP